MTTGKERTLVKLLIGHDSELFDKPRSDGHTLRWTMFVRPTTEHNFVDREFIKTVKFRLHESYSEPTRTVKHPPFQVTETGYGSFPIALEISFNYPGAKTMKYSYDMIIALEKKSHTSQEVTFELKDAPPNFIELAKKYGAKRKRSSGGDETILRDSMFPPLKSMRMDDSRSPQTSSPSLKKSPPTTVSSLKKSPPISISSSKKSPPVPPSSSSKKSPLSMSSSKKSPLASVSSSSLKKAPLDSSSLSKKSSDKVSNDHHKNREKLGEDHRTKHNNEKEKEKSYRHEKEKNRDKEREKDRQRREDKERKEMKLSPEMSKLKKETPSNSPKIPLRPSIAPTTKPKMHAPSKTDERKPVFSETDSLQDISSPSTSYGSITPRTPMSIGGMSTTSSNNNLSSSEIQKRISTLTDEEQIFKVASLLLTLPGATFLPSKASLSYDIDLSTADPSTISRLCEALS